MRPNAQRFLEEIERGVREPGGYICLLDTIEDWSQIWLAEDNTIVFDVDLGVLAMEKELFRRACANAGVAPNATYVSLDRGGMVLRPGREGDRIRGWVQPDGVEVYVVCLESGSAEQDDTCNYIHTASGTRLKLSDAALPVISSLVSTLQSDGKRISGS